MKFFQGALLFLATATSSSAQETINGVIYCDNYFEFYFNGELIKQDPMTFIPHQAVEVSFEWDGVSDKEYAIMCQDFATDSGYEYTQSSSRSAGLGDGALVAAFSDGTRTSSSWKSYVVTYGPTEDSEEAGCSASNLDVCVVEDRGEPDNWFGAGFDFSSWDDATEYSSNEAGWGRSPTWTEGSGCCQSISPLTAEALETNNGCSVNLDVETLSEVATDVTEADCQNPRSFFDTGAEYSDATFVWGTSLTKDNKMFFRFTQPSASSETVSSPSSAPIVGGESTSTSSPAATPTSATTEAPVTTSAGIQESTLVIITLSLLNLVFLQ